MLEVGEVADCWFHVITRNHQRKLTVLVVDDAHRVEKLRDSEIGVVDGIAQQAYSLQEKGELVMLEPH